MGVRLACTASAKAWVAEAEILRRRRVIVICAFQQDTVVTCHASCGMAHPPAMQAEQVSFTIRVTQLLTRTMSNAHSSRNGPVCGRTNVVLSLTSQEARV